jgi:hypothetical protein
MTESRSVLRRIPRWVWLVAFLPGLIAQLSNIGAAVQASEPDKVFIGARHQARDFAVYMATARYYGESGDRGAPNLFVTEAQDGRMIMSYLWMVGQLAQGTGMDLVWAWRVMGLLSCWLFFVLVWVLARRLLPDKETGNMAFMMVCFSGGLGWILFGFNAGIWPSLDVDAKALNEFWNWSSIGSAQIPMWCAGHALFVGAMLVFIDRKHDDYKPHPLRALFMAMLLVACFFVHPYTGLTAFLVLGLFSAWTLLAQRKNKDCLAVMAPVHAFVGLAMAGATVASVMYWAGQDPVYAKTMEMSSLWRPGYEVIWWPLMYGVPFLLALYALRKRQGPVVLLGLWFCSILILSRLSIWPGVKFQFLVHLPMCLLAALGLAAMKPSGWNRALKVGLFIVLFTATPIHLLRSIAQAQDAPASYVPSAQLRLLNELDSLPPGAVMTSYQGGLWVPWKAGKPVFLGHWFMSYDFQGRSKAMFRFWSDDTAIEEKRKFIRAQGIRYLVVDPWTKEMGAVPEELGAIKRYDNPFGEIWVIP